MADVIPLPRRRSITATARAADRKPGRVASLMEHKHQDTIAVLRSTLRKALRGEIKGVAICVLSENGEDFAFTGIFKQDSARALKAVRRMDWKLNLALDEIESEE